MKKVVSLVKACMTSDMSIFKIKSKNSKKNKGLVFIVSFCFMFAIWSYANMLLEGLAPLHLQYIALSLFIRSGTDIFSISPFLHDQCRELRTEN